MAIINSIALGKARGSIGNTILQSYGGRTIIRQKNTSISTEPTDLQIQQQNKMFNCGRSFSYLAPFLSFWKPRSVGSLSNAAYFTKNTSQLFTNFRALRGFQAVRQLAGTSFGINRFLIITNIELLFDLGVKSGVRLSFSWIPEQWDDNVNVRILCSNIVFDGGFMPINTIQQFEHIITLDDINNGYIDYFIEDFDNQFVVAYTDQYYTKSDGLFFSQIFA